MNCALYFGSFNPVHFGHTAIAKYLSEMEEIDKVMIIPSPQNPLKDTGILAPAEQRLRQVRKDFCGISDKIEISDIEYHLEKPLYTIRTLQKLQEIHPDYNLILTIGADNILIIEKWAQWREILSNYEIIVYPRDGYDCVTKCMELAPICKKLTYLEDAPLLKISSTQIREGKRLKSTTTPDTDVNTSDFSKTI